MKLDIHIYNEVGVINLSNCFDFSIHREFKQAYTLLLENQAVKEIKIDLKHVGFLDSAALGMLMLLRDRANMVNKTVVLSQPSPGVASILNVANFDRLFVMIGIQVEDLRKPSM